MRSGHLIYIASALGGVALIIAVVATALIVRARENATPVSLAALPAAHHSGPTPGGPFTPAAGNVIHTDDDALRVAVELAGSDLVSAKLTSVEFTRSNAASALRMFEPSTTADALNLSENQSVWVIVAQGTFVRITPGVSSACPCTYHTAWAVAVKGKDLVLHGFDPASYDLPSLGQVVTVPPSVWARYQH